MTRQDAVQIVTALGWRPTGYFDPSGSSLWSCPEAPQMLTLRQIMSSAYARQPNAA